MAVRKGKKTDEGKFAKTALNLAKKGKTNKKLKSNPMAMKNETPENKRLTEAAALFRKEHPKGSGRKYNKAS